MTLPADAPLANPSANDRAAENAASADRFAPSIDIFKTLLTEASHDSTTLTSGNQAYPSVLEYVSDAIQAFKTRPSAHATHRLRAVRRHFCHALRHQSQSMLEASWSSPINEVYRCFLASGIIDHPRDEADEAVFATLSADLVTEFGKPGWLPCIQAAMQFGRSYEYRIPPSLDDIPDWFRAPYLEFLLTPPALFNNIGDADRYIDHLEDLVALIHRTVISSNNSSASASARVLSSLFMKHASFLQSYFNSRNLKSVYAKRGDLLAASLLATGAKTLWANPPELPRTRKLRFGIYASHLGPQTETYFTISHFEGIDRSRFHVILYSDRRGDHPLEAHCMTLADEFVLLPERGINEKVERIRKDDLDVLLIGTNMTAVTNVPALLGAYRLARIQIASVSSPVTTGARHIDVLLSAEWNEPDPAAADHYTERLYLMPGSVNYYAYQYDTTPATVTMTRARLGIRDDQVVFFSAASFPKVLPELSQIWAKILSLVPESVLLLMPFNPNWSKAYQTGPFVARIRRQMAAVGVAPDRLRVVATVPARADVHRIMSNADIYLDGHPFSGACSMLDPIIVGVPPVARSGGVGRSNHAASLLRMVGMDDLVASSETDYIAVATGLARDKPLRDRIRKRLGEISSMTPPPYFDIGVFSRRVANAIGDLYDQHTRSYTQLRTAGASSIKGKLRSLAAKKAGRNFELNSLTDIGLIHSLVVPFFKSCGATKHVPHLIDVGACLGQMAAPLLAQGWTADLFEPDPSSRSKLEMNMARFGSRCRIHGAAITISTENKVRFHQAAVHGLSGLSASPFAGTRAIIDVDSITLAGFLARSSSKIPDFLKIDAEGFDFEVLASNDFDRFRPRLILVEYGTHFPRQDIASVNQALSDMASKGYGSIIFNYDDDGNFANGNWLYRLNDLLIDAELPDQRSRAFGNIIFYLADDLDFLLSVHSVLDQARQSAE